MFLKNWRIARSVGLLKRRAGGRMKSSQVTDTSRAVYKLVVHRIDIAFHGSREDAESLAKFFNVAETKESSGDKYKAMVFKESKGESITVYQYSDKTIVRVNTHRLERRRAVVDYITKFGLSVVRDYMELYSRIHDNYESVVNSAVYGYAEVKGLGLFSQTVTREWKRLVYLTRTDKHSLSGDVQGVLKFYRDRELKEDPKLEIEFWTRGRLLGDSDIQLAGRVLNTILKLTKALTKARVVYNDYDKAQDSILIDYYDRSLHRQLFATLKRISLTMLVNKNYRDKRLVIAELLDRGLRPIDISRLTGYNRQYIYEIVDQLIDMGILERIGRGKYRIKSRRLKDDVKHPLPHYMIVNLEYDEIHVITIPYRQWNKMQLLQYYTNQGWISYEINKSIDAVLVFYRNNSGKYDYLLVKRVIM